MSSASGREATTTVLGPASASVASGDPFPIATGTRVSRYIVLDEAGRGGMGRVLRAYDPKLQREVALKEVGGSVVGPQDAARLVAEARAMAMLSHANVVAVHDVEELPAREGAKHVRVVLVMEYVHGTTLQAWLAAARHPWHRIVACFVAAGHGLAAAHAAGVLHRDFKPANVLLGDGGIVKVTDFGLAKVHDPSFSEAGTTDGADAPDPPESSPVGLTRTGTVMGSPRYMAPEQHRGEALGPTADQYAFCVALWESLAGAAPFVGNTLVALCREKEKGPPPFPRTSVPRHIVAALRRGLAVDPRDRWSSMPALLAELSDDPARRRRRWVVAGMGTLALVGATATVWVADRDAPCKGAEAHMAGVWDDATRASVRDAMLGTSATFAVRVWERTELALDGYASAWTAMHTDACEATAVRAEQSAEVMDLRMACLQRARIELRAIVAALAEADVETLKNAHEAVDGLRPLSRCADVEALEQDVEPPLPAEAEAVERVRTLLAEAAAAHAAGRYARARDRLDDAERALEGVHYEPIRTEVALARGTVLRSLGEYEAAEAMLRHTLGEALRLRQWDEMFRASVSLMNIVTRYRARVDEAMRYREIAEALAGDDPARQARVSTSVTHGLLEKGEFAEAEAEARRSLALRENALGPDHPEIAVSLNHLAGALHEQGHGAQAEAQYRRVLELRVRALGPEHPLVAQARGNLAVVLDGQGKSVEAMDEQGRALAVLEAALGPEHPTVAQARANQANYLDAVGESARAVAEYRKAAATLERSLGPRHPDLANTLHNLSSTLANLGEHEEAEDVERRVLAIRIASLGAEHPRTADSHQRLGVILHEQHRYPEAEAEYRRALEVRESTLGADHPDVQTLRGTIALVLEAQGRLEDAEAVHRSTIEGLTASLGEDHPATLVARHNFAATLAKADRADEAEAEYRSVLARWEGSQSRDTHYARGTRLALAEMLVARGRPEEALPLAEQAVAHGERSEVSLAEQARAAFLLARALAGTGSRERAVELAGEALEAFGRAGEAHADAAAEVRDFIDEPTAKVSRARPRAPR